MWELDYKESWALKNWCFWTVVLENTVESPLGCKEIQPIHPKGNQSWMFIGRTDVEAATPIFWPPDVKSWLISKDPDAGKDWRQEEKGTTEEMVGWHHLLNSGSWWWTGKPGVLQYMGSQRVRHDWATELSLILWVFKHVDFCFCMFLFFICRRRMLCEWFLHIFKQVYFSLLFFFFSYSPFLLVVFQCFLS